jgi:hypothetical protein
MLKGGFIMFQSIRWPRVAGVAGILLGLFMALLLCGCPPAHSSASAPAGKSPQTAVTSGAKPNGNSAAPAGNSMPAAVAACTKPTGNSAPATSHFANEHLSFDYSSTMTSPDADSLEGIRKGMASSGIEFVSCYKTSDERLILLVAREKMAESFEALYAEKTARAKEVNTNGLTVQGNQFTKLTVTKDHLADGTPIMTEYGEKSDGQVACTVDILVKGYNYVLMFISPDKDAASQGDAERNRVLKTVKLKP